MSFQKLSHFSQKTPPNFVKNSMHRNCLLSKQHEKNSVFQEKTQKFSQKLNASEPRSTHQFQSDAQKKAWFRLPGLFGKANSRIT